MDFTLQCCHQFEHDQRLWVCNTYSLVNVELHDDAVAFAAFRRVERAAGLAVARAEVRVAVEAVRAQLAAGDGRQQEDRQRSRCGGHDSAGGEDAIVEIECLLDAEKFDKIRRDKLTLD